MNKSESLDIKRDYLALGKYTCWASRLSSDQLVALLWMIGEFGVRSSPDNANITHGHEGRKEAARKAIINFVHGNPVSLEQAKRQIIEACKD